MALAVLLGLALIGAVAYAIGGVVGPVGDRRARARAWGALLGTLVGFLTGVLLGDFSWMRVLVCTVVGILVGVLGGEAAGGEPTPLKRGASLRPRRLSDYVPWIWLAVPVAGLVADAAVVTIGLRPHRTGAAAATCDGTTWQAWLRWPSRPALLAATVAAVLLVALLGAVLRTIVRRRQTVHHPDHAAADDAQRALTARQAIALTSAGQLLLLSGVAWNMGHGYVTPCQDRPALTAGALAVVAFIGAIGMLVIAGRTSRRPTRVGDRVPIP